MALLHTGLDFHASEPEGEGHVNRSPGCVPGALDVGNWTLPGQRGRFAPAIPGEHSLLGKELTP